MLAMFVFTVSSCKIVELIEKAKLKKKAEFVETIKKEVFEIEKNLKKVGIQFDDIKISKEAVDKGIHEIVQILGDEGIEFDELDLSIIKLVLVQFHFEVLAILGELGVKADAENDSLIKLASAHFKVLKTLTEDPGNTKLLNRVKAKEADSIEKSLSDIGVKVGAEKNNILSKVDEVQSKALEKLKVVTGFEENQTIIKSQTTIMVPVNNVSIPIIIPNVETDKKNEIFRRMSLAKGYFKFVKTLSELDSSANDNTSVNADKKCKEVF